MPGNASKQQQCQPCQWGPGWCAQHCSPAGAAGSRGSTLCQGRGARGPLSQQHLWCPTAATQHGVWSGLAGATYSSQRSQLCAAPRCPVQGVEGLRRAVQCMVCTCPRMCMCASVCKRATNCLCLLLSPVYCHHAPLCGAPKSGGCWEPPPPRPGPQQLHPAGRQHPEQQPLAPPQR
jgi:hypothetical protein